MNMRPLPCLDAVCAQHKYVVLFWDERVEGRALLGVGARRSLSVARPTPGDWALWQAFVLEGERRNAWTTGWLGYDLHGSLDLARDGQTPRNVPEHPGGWPLLVWWEPEVVVEWPVGQSEAVLVWGGEVPWANEVLAAARGELAGGMPREAAATPPSAPRPAPGSWAALTPSWSEDEYRMKFEEVHRALQRGDIYEMNLCMPWEGRAPGDGSWSIFSKLAEKTKAPHTAYVQAGMWRTLCASPERFLAKRGAKLLSQPIKGTVRRGSTPAEDKALKAQLASSEKERAENVMIVDLVRNDLSRVAERDSVAVEELFGIHTFDTVHQMISTVSCTLRPEVSTLDILRATFPMGSMTGAPKLSAMNHIARLEGTGRGVYSGAIGYVEPSGDWDLNVVIRSLMHRADSGRVDATVGGAITLLSQAESEYEECLLKAEALRQCLVP
jgi:para-aminobenzoate synthetase component 1